MAIDLHSLAQRAVGAVPASAKAAVTFTKRTAGAADASMRPGAPASASVAGTAVQESPDLRRYEALKLTPSSAMTLYFTPAVAGESPAMGAEVSWGGVTYTVRDVRDYAPGGTVIGASVVVAR